MIGIWSYDILVLISRGTCWFSIAHALFHLNTGTQWEGARIKHSVRESVGRTRQGNWGAFVSWRGWLLCCWCNDFPPPILLVRGELYVHTDHYCISTAGWRHFTCMELINVWMVLSEILVYLVIILSQHHTVREFSDCLLYFMTERLFNL